MKIAGRHSFSKSRQEIWKALQDPETLAATLPGVRRLEVVEPDRYAVAAQVGVGSVKGLFEGTFGVEDKKDFESCLLRGSARGASGSAVVEASVQLSDSNGGTLLDYDASASVTGPIAGVGQRMIAAASRRMAAQFFDAIDAYDGTAPGLAPATTEVTPGQVFQRPPSRTDPNTFVRGVVVGFALALVGVAVGRWSAKGRG